MKKNNKGFTLIELMIVIAILGILAAIIIPQISGHKKRSNNSQTQVKQTIQVEQPAQENEYNNNGKTIIVVD